MRKVPLILLGFGFLLFFAYQIVAVVYVEEGAKVNFLGVTAVFLQIIAFFMTILVFLATSLQTKSIMEVIQKDIDQSKNSLATELSED